MRGIAALGIILVILGGCSPFYRYINVTTGIEIRDDNVLEEFGEEVLCDQTGICQDFTPDSPEHD